MTLTDFQRAALRDASKLPEGIPVATQCILALVRAKLLTIQETPAGVRAKITAAGLETLTQGTP